MASTRNNKEPIAIIGSGCRFPGGGNSASKLWEMLQDPKDYLSPIPTDRFSAQGFYNENGQYHGHSNVKDSYLLAEDRIYRKFDASFFGISPVEANAIDPQARLLLETVYEAIDAAGQTIEGLQGSNTGCYVGLMCGDYEQVMSRDPDSMANYHATGVSRALMSNRISYFFDWHGPSMTIDTACSSSLVAMHQGVQLLRSGDAKVAVAAGTNLLLDPYNYIAESKLQMLSASSRSRMWDADASGYARGEGIAAVVMKTLSQAEADGDQIECVIRETGCNQDGKTKGITMPSATAQADLIRSCYTQAGLNPLNPADRPQFFEAHGTGTPAGDPIEAEAISSAFFEDNGRKESGDNKLFVGSIKTVVGHTEGTAGLAAVLKASLALQNGFIPPNLLFNRLSARVEPFYSNLKIPTQLTPWPSLPDDQPRRASVNSFGFGGANAHAILESYTPKPKAIQQPEYREPKAFAPFVFSAASERSLVAYVASYSEYLKAKKDSTNLRDLAYTLHSRRTRLPVAAAFSASTVEGLFAKLDEKLQIAEIDKEKPVGTRSAPLLSSGKPKILGVFTGQGAQWPRMGAELIETSEPARKTIEALEKRLAQLPAEDRPKWSLMEEMLKDASSSKIGEARLSQPLCTALQVVLVDHLNSTGIEFAAVVGHSSGEIGAAYAAGLISREDAICIAYYRGLHSTLALGPDGQKGAMMAVGTSFEDAEDLCMELEFEGRVSVAACNSSASVTLSGDSDAIDEMKVVFDDEKKFARRLNVDKAYHSHHMIPCSDSYIRSLKALNIEIHPSANCTWFSSVYGEDIADARDKLRDVYWDSNMVNPVLFMQAVERAVTVMGPFDLAIEVGPHPALKGPALQTIGDLSQHPVPYTGLLSRGKNDVESLAEGLGFIWTLLGKGVVDLEEFDRFASGGTIPRLINGLPSYPWDHEKEYWHESRYARTIRTRPNRPHELLGHMAADSSEQEMRWRHFLRPKEISWLKGHQLQNQMVFPAAGYVVAAMEAALTLIKGQSATLIEMLDLDIHQALVFDDENSSVETIVSLSDIQRQGEAITTRFKYFSLQGKDSDALSLMASGIVKLFLGEPSETILPAKLPPQPNTIPIESERFYTSMDRVGYGYTGPFRALSHIDRKLGNATGLISNLEKSTLIVHPATLDAAFQAVLLAHCFPDDGRLWSLHVPKTIRSIRVNPHLCASDMAKGKLLPFSSTQPSDHLASIRGDVDIYPEGVDHAMIQVELLDCIPFSQASAHDDKQIFSTIVWDFANPNIENLVLDCEATETQQELATILERVAYYYLHKLDLETPADHPARSEGPYRNYLKFAEHVHSLVASGQHQCGNFETENFTIKDVTTATERFPDSIDLKMLSTVGQNIVSAVKGETMTMDHAMNEIPLDLYYSKGLGFEKFIVYMAKLLRQFTHRYPHMNILEIGAGTGAATKVFLEEIEQKFSSYTFTDKSNESFGTAEKVFKDFQEKMNFKVLDMSKDPRQQGFTENSYDLVIASMVLHATPTLEDTLKNVRRLLKPGGYLVIMEMSTTEVIRTRTILGGLANSWQGESDGHVLSPCITQGEWDQVLRSTGFSGCDTTMPDLDPLVFPLTIIASQAVDDRITFLREPLSSAPELFKPGLVMQDLVLLGGQSIKTSKVIGQLSNLLRQYCGSIKTIRSLADVAAVEISPITTVLSLAELDDPVFKTLTPVKFDAVKKIMEEANTVLWVAGSRNTNPYTNATVGLVRSVLREIPTLNFQFLDVDDAQKQDALLFAESLLRFRAATLWKNEDSNKSLHMTVEPEIMVENGQMMIPRVVASKALNDRYNSPRRPISKVVDPRTERVSLNHATSGYYLRRQPEPLQIEDSAVQVDVTHSLLSSIKLPQLGSVHLILGKDSESGNQVTGLSRDQASIAYCAEKFLIPCQSIEGQEAEFISLVAQNMLILDIIQALSSGDRVVVHEPGLAFATTLEREARAKSIKTTFTTCSVTKKQQGWIALHPQAPDRVIQQSVPKDASVFVDLSHRSGIGGVGDRIASHMPIYCRCENLESLFGHESWMVSHAPTGLIHDQLKAAVSLATEAQAKPEELDLSIDTVSLTSLSQHDSILGLRSTVDWTVSSSISISVEAVDANPMFSSSKTYWLCGLSGTLGLSLCEWMVRHGAKHVAITSRNPSIAESWLEKMTYAGANVKTFAFDITNRKEVAAVYKKICSTMPPIGGVAQGAMVMQDTPIRDMTAEIMLKVTKPKIEGSIYLDEILAKDDLEFFIFFSSIVGVIGNAGQANYGAGNNFMVGLAEQRRRKGLAASVIEIGPVLGVGYIAQEEADSKGNLSRQIGHMFISEQDFLHQFAEGVLAGRPNSGGSCEVSSGLHNVSAAEQNRPNWFSNPIFSHYILPKDTAGTGDSDNKSNAPIKTQLSAATSQDQVYNILSASFIAKIRSLFQIEGDKVDDGLAKSRLDELGIDSLIAVDIRSWFMKSLDVNIPVLKILSGVTIGELITAAMESLSPTLTPSLKTGDSTPPSPPSEKLDTPATTTVTTSSASDSGNQDDFSELNKASSVTSAEVSDPKEDLRTNIPDPIVQKTMELSFSQAMFWFVTVFLEDKSGLNHTGCFKLTGKIRVEDFGKAVKAIGQRHGALRTCFVNDGGQPKQGIIETSVLHLEHRQISHEKQVPMITRELEKHVYDLERGETMRIQLLSLSSDVHYFLCGAHHLVVDGISFQILLKDLLLLYNHQVLDSNIMQYPEYSQGQHRDYKVGKYSNELKFWKNEFSDFPPQLPILRVSPVVSRPALKSYEDLRVDLKIDSGLKSQIQAVCRRCKVTPFHFYLAALRALLTRYADADDVAIGICDANRNEDDVSGSIGPYLNLLPLRFRNNEATRNFEDVLQETRVKSYSALANSRVPFQVLLNELNAPRSSNHSPIFQCFVDYRLGQSEKTAWGDCQMELMTFQAGGNAYDLSFDIIDDPHGGVRVMLVVRQDIYSKSAAETLLKSYESLVKSFAKDSNVPLSKPDLFQQSDIENAVNLGRGPSFKSQWPETLVHRIDKLSQIQPDAPAVRSGKGEIVKFSQMAEKTNSIAANLIAAGVKAGSRVAVLQEPTPEWISSILAIMRVGAIYLPLDMSTPLTRLAVIVNDCKPNVVLVDENTERHVVELRAKNMKTVNISTLTSATSTPPISATADSAAMILYTSGSSGVPKGIILKHEGLRNWIEPAGEMYNLNSESIVLQQSSSSFDMSFTQIFTALSFGGSVYVLPRSLRGDALAITGIIASEGITFTSACPSEYFSWIKYGHQYLLRNSNWILALSAGEPVVDALMQQFTKLGKKDLRFFNSYGPTEISLVTTAMELFYMKDSMDSIGAGYTLPNYSVYVVDENMKIVPPGVQGEIYVGGAGVAAGYLDNETLTAEKFVPDVFATPDYKVKGWTTMHRTGDLGRWRADGAILIEGRISGDTQVKLRGLRIDLQDIEVALVESSKGAITEAVMSVRRTSPQSPEFLVAHVVFDAKYPMGEREHLVNTLPSSLPLPQYMCPAVIVPLTQMPSTVSGKLDRRAVAALPLPEAVREQKNSNTNVILTETETDLKKIWQDVVSQEIASLYRIDSNTDFFHVGGTSLLLLNLQAQIRNKFGTILPLVQMFDASTLGAMARRIDNSKDVIVELFDWERETELSPATLKLRKGEHVIQQDPKVVVLTGATGFLGSGLLKALVEDPDIEKVHCIGVRNASSRKDLLSLSKVSLYEGNLTSPRLGLTEKDAKTIFSKADRIIHNGADVSHLKTFQSLRLANLQSTKEIVEMSFPRQIPIHYISTAGVGIYSGEETFHEASATPHPPPEDAFDGYTASKWTSERFLEKVNQHSQWPVWIHRPSSIVRKDIPELELMQNLLKYSRLLNAVPYSPNMRGVLDLVSLDSVVQGITQELHAQPQKEVQFWHQSGDLDLPLQNMKAFLDRETGGDVEELPVEEWAMRARERGLHEILVAFFENVKDLRVVSFPRLVKDNPRRG